MDFVPFLRTLGHHELKLVYVVFIALVVWVIAWFGVACEMMDSFKNEFWFDFLKHSFLLIYFFIFSAVLEIVGRKGFFKLVYGFCNFWYETVDV